jgi:hypothetical protein
MTAPLKIRGVAVRRGCNCGLCRKARGLAPLDESADTLARRRKGKARRWTPRTRGKTP